MEPCRNANLQLDSGTDDYFWVYFLIKLFNGIKIFGLGINPEQSPTQIRILESPLFFVGSAVFIRESVPDLIRSSELAVRISGPL